MNKNKTNIIYKNIFITFLSFFFLSFVSCEFNFNQLKQLFSEDDDQKEITDPTEEPSNTSQEEETIKTYLEINNQSQFAINIFLQTPENSSDNLSPWTTIEAGTSTKKEIAPSASIEGDIIYVQYKIEIPESETESFEILYFDTSTEDALKACVKTKYIEKGKINKITIPTLSAMIVNKSYIILQNESDTDIVLYDKVSSPLIPLNETANYWIYSGQYKIYELNDSMSFSDFLIGTDLIKKPLEIGMDFAVTGFIYNLCYTADSKTELLNIKPINVSDKSKMWKMDVSQETGKFLTIDNIFPRENPVDGFFVTGQLSYNADSKDVESKLYLGKITPDGIVNDKVPYLKNNPKKMADNVFVEKDGNIVVAGLVDGFDINDNVAALYLYGEGNYNFYFIDDKVKNVSEVKKLIAKNNNIFSVLYNYKYKDSESHKVGFGIYELSICADNSVEGKVVFEDTNNILAKDFIYANDDYVILGQEDFDDDGKYDQSCLLFIEQDFFETKETLTLSHCLLNSMVHSTNDSYAYVCGITKNVKTDKAEAFVVCIDLQQNVVTNKKSFSTSKDYLNSCFECLAINDKELLLAGKIDYLGEDDTASGYPYLVSINITSDFNSNFDFEKTRYVSVYKQNNETNFEGYEISGCFLSEIGTPLIVLKNKISKNTFIASCNFLGQMPGNETELASLPRSSDIASIAPPEIKPVLDEQLDNHEEVTDQVTPEMNNESIEEEISDVESEPEPVYTGPNEVTFNLSSPWTTHTRGGVLHTGHKRYTAHCDLTITSNNENEYFSHYEIIHAGLAKPYITTNKSYHISIYTGKTYPGTFEVTVYAVDIFGEKSSPCTKKIYFFKQKF